MGKRKKIKLIKNAVIKKGMTLTLYDTEGEPQAIVVPYEHWQKLTRAVGSIVKQGMGPAQPKQPIPEDEWGQGDVAELDTEIPVNAPVNEPVEHNAEILAQQMAQRAAQTQRDLEKVTDPTVRAQQHHTAAVMATQVDEDEIRQRYDKGPT